MRRVLVFCVTMALQWFFAPTAGHAQTGLADAYRGAANRLIDAALAHPSCRMACPAWAYRWTGPVTSGITTPDADTIDKLDAREMALCVANDGGDGLRGRGHAGSATALS